MNGREVTDAVAVSGQRLPYLLRRSNRRTLEIAVLPDRSVVVVAPLDAPLARIRAKVRLRVSWIRRQLRRFEDLRPLPTPRRFVGGETHRYIGRQYRLRVARGRLEQVKLAGGWLRVTTGAPRNRARVRALVESWYDVRAHDLLSVRLSEGATRTRGLVPLPSIMVRKMSKRWESCTPSGRLVLNVDLVKTPLSCIDYVITHELCHLKAMNHGPAFRRLLTRIMPDWRERRAILDRQEV